MFVRGMHHWIGRPRKPLPRPKHHIDQQTGCEVVAIFCISKMAVSRRLGFMEPQIVPFDPLTPKTLALNQTWSGLDALFARYLPLNYTVTLKLGFGVT